jgi:hypothetical protein
MAKDHQIAVRVNTPTNKAIKEFAEKHDYTKAEAVRRMVEARLAGEGHMEGATITDGGITEQIDNQFDEIKSVQKDSIQQIESEVSEASKTIEDLRDLEVHLKKISVPILLSLLWIGIEATFGVPGGTPVVVGSGLLLVSWLALVEVRWWLDE